MCLKKMKPSKSPDVKIFLDRRYQKCVFKKNESLYYAYSKKDKFSEYVDVNIFPDKKCFQRD